MTYVIAEPCIDVMDRGCVEECPVDCIIDDNARFFHQPLPGEREALGAPGGAQKLGPTGVDTALVAGYPTADEQNANRTSLHRDGAP